MRNGVKLRACEDRLCQDCYEKNEVALRALRVSDNSEQEVNSDAGKCKNDGVKLVPNSVQTVNLSGVVEQLSRAASCSASDSDAGEDETCSACLSSVRRTNEYLKCDVCCQKIHVECTSLPLETGKALFDYVAVLGYVCEECRQSMKASFFQLRGAVSILTEELATLRAELTELKVISATQITTDKLQPRSGVDEQTRGTGASDRLENPNSSAYINVNVQSGQQEKDKVPTDIATIVHQTLKDSERRKRNVVITGLPESADTDDRTQVLELFEQHLSKKPHISDRACVRLGKPVSNQPLPRKLLVHLSSEAVAQDVLSSAKNLRHCKNEMVSKSIYINADLSPSEAKLEYERRQKRRIQQKQKLSVTLQRDNQDRHAGATNHDTEHDQAQALSSPRSFPNF